MNEFRNLLPSAIAVITLLLTTLIPPDRAEAQTSIGASYELRDEHPTNGIGLRIQQEFLSVIPLVDLGMRGHFSFFSEEIDASDQSYTTDITNYDFGLAVMGGVNVGLLKPYVGAGLGSENYKAVTTGVEQQEFDESSFYWNVFVGAELSPIPVLKPFIEYRFTRMFDDDAFDYKQNGRVAIGLSIHF